MDEGVGVAADLVALVGDLFLGVAVQVDGDEGHQRREVDRSDEEAALKLDGFYRHRLFQLARALPESFCTCSG